MRRKSYLISRVVLPVLAAAIWVGMIPPLGASSLPGQRFEIHKVKYGFLRFDRQTGMTSFCSRTKLKWQCEDIGKNRLNIPALHYGHKTNNLTKSPLLNRVHEAFVEMGRRFMKFAGLLSPN